MEMRAGRPRPDCPECGDYIGVDGEPRTGWVELTELNDLVVAVADTFWTTIMVPTAAGGQRVDSKAVKLIAEDLEIVDFVIFLKRIIIYVTNYLMVIGEREPKETQPKKDKK